MDSTLHMDSIRKTWVKKTAKRPRLDWDWTGKDQKFARLIKTTTAVQSSVFVNLKIVETDKKPV
ncbi:hypothetical protein GALMADRAFT_148826 [Galerina marginata CBS 339.88]|uniref:Uncharacterized protein n=1 Tax=Galerina marginata (strain CBS 339.88) TaxID=685588 RepID=A0A067S362_GALM3|nr:hypothetical protein GALMADRAFT_148826 [Galerina marginata CBS 339.88]